MRGGGGGGGDYLIKVEVGGRRGWVHEGVMASVDSCGLYLRTHSAGLTPCPVTLDTPTHSEQLCPHTEKHKTKKEKKCQQSAWPFSQHVL